MWLVHEASKPTAVLARAGQDQNLWRKWQGRYGHSHPWLFDWLYDFRASVPPEAKGGPVPTALMAAFREAATVNAIAAAARRDTAAVKSTNPRAGKAHVPVPLIFSWLEKYERVPWVRRWLLRGEDPPAGVVVASVEQIRHCRAVWDYTGHCRAAGTKAHHTYTRWLEFKTFPDLGWLRWLLGDEPPDGCFVIPPSFQKLREELCQGAVCDAANVDRSTLPEWRKNSALTAALQAIQDAVAQGKSITGPGPWDGLHPRTRNNMVAYARAATIAAARERVTLDDGKAGLSEQQYGEVLRRAQARGCKEELLAYLAVQNEPHGDRWKNWAKVGPITPKLFIATPAMLAFRRAAQKAMSQWPTNQQALRALPGFEEWLADWTSPPPWRDKRKSLPRSYGNPTEQSLPAAARESALITAEEKQRPRWDAQRRQLWVGRILVRQYDRQAGNQQALLQAFEDALWSASVPSPLARGLLPQTIKDLNRTLKKSPLRFALNNKGASATWGLR
jgi:hypothetical protein